MRLLLVDDNPDTVGVLAVLLRRLGHEVHVAHDGPTAVTEARSLLPEVMLLDIGLPGLNGYEVAQELRRTSELASCKLVAMTGYGQQEDIDRAMQSGFDRHLLKPVRIDAINTMLASL
jgi:CheY-like chemotaxis protein